MTYKFILGYADESCMGVPRQNVKDELQKIGKELDFKVMSVNFIKRIPYAGERFGVQVEITTDKDIHDICKNLLWHNKNVLCEYLHEYHILK